MACYSRNQQRSKKGRRFRKSIMTTTLSFWPKYRQHFKEASIHSAATGIYEIPGCISESLQHSLVVRYVQQHMMETGRQFSTTTRFLVLAYRSQWGLMLTAHRQALNTGRFKEVRSSFHFKRTSMLLDDDHPKTILAFRLLSAMSNLLAHM